MPICAKTTNPHNSSWYNIMERKAQVWNEYAKLNGVEIEGGYSAESLSFEMQFELDDKNILIDGRRQLSSVTNNLIPRNGVIAETLNIKSDVSLDNKECYFEVKKNGFWHSIFRSKKKFNYHNVIEKYSVSYNSENLFRVIQQSQILKTGQVRKLKMDQGGFHLFMLELPENLSDLEKLLSLCTGIMKVCP